MFKILGVTFYWYGLLIGIGVWLATEISLWKRNGIKQEVLESSMFWVIPAGLIGARLYHVIDLWNRYYSTNLPKVFSLWDGGLGIWGAIAGGIAGLAIYCYFERLKFFKILDVLVLGVPLAQTIGRLGNFINGEIMGKNGEPLFAYEGLLNLVLFTVLLSVSKKGRKTGLTSGIYLAGYGLIRIALENMRPEGAIWKVLGVPMAMIFGAISIIFGGYLIFRKKRP